MPTSWTRTSLRRFYNVPRLEDTSELPTDPSTERNFFPLVICRPFFLSVALSLCFRTHFRKDFITLSDHSFKDPRNIYTSHRWWFMSEARNTNAFLQLAALKKIRVCSLKSKWFRMSLKWLTLSYLCHSN